MSQTTSSRRWFTDAVTALAFFILAFYLTRATKGMPIVALFVLAVTGGTGYVFARSAWRSLMGDRSVGVKKLSKQ